jgi:glutaredoxin
MWVMTNVELVMYTRRMGCPFVTLAKRVLSDYAVPYREVFIDIDDGARRRVLAWTGFLSVPTLVAAQPGEDMPYQEPEMLVAGSSPRGINRGSMITEPNIEQLLNWLAQHGFIEQEQADGAH